MSRIREVLRYEYIGAVAIGFLLAQLIGIVIGLIMRPVNFYLEQASGPRSVFGRVETATFPWGSLIGPVIDLMLLGLISFLLFRWLYPAANAQQKETGSADNSPDDQETGGTL